MRVATITCHDVYNYGASLQAYALQEYFRSLGDSYEIINYKPNYLSQHYKLTTVANPIFDKPFIRLLYILAKLPGRLHSLKRKRCFDRFTQQYLNLSAVRYGSFEELMGNPPQADIYLAGSDQIWNTFFKNGLDPAFYLDFIKDREGIKASYAASFATDAIFNNAEAFVASELQNFDVISVRESSAINLLKTLGREGATLVCDPVFLRTKDEWESDFIPLTSSKAKYIAVYDCEQSENLRNIALYLKQITGLPIYNLSDTYGRYSDKDYSLIGPLEFLTLIGNAEYIVANSFHALAFSLIFEKEFFIINRSEKINTRMRDFLSYLHLGNRLISAPNELKQDKIDYKIVNTFLSDLIQNSKEFIKELRILCRANVLS
ncbi:MAG: polysaccharide pyruvyl transferase family protein [Bacteroidales bacterium]|nr:polysaccharide pyruvyl transferase family protein [Bacteroidales bacterium]